VYDISNNQITSAVFIGTVGLDWQVAGFGPMHGPGTSDMALRKINTGAFEVFDIANNQLTTSDLLGQVGLDYLRVCPKTSGGITKFSEHEAD
jgi:hypothetical protein